MKARSTQPLAAIPVRNGRVMPQANMISARQLSRPIGLPRLSFMHFWANGDAVKLAAGLRQALDQINLVRG
jgi:hypothetical protein